MEEYYKGNKEAWEEALQNSNIDFGEKDSKRLKEEKFPFLHTDFITKLEEYDFRGKTIGQFCCNNGRELMSVVKNMEAKEGIGFDIAENIVSQANHNAEQADINCVFYDENILFIGSEFNERFDVVLIMIGTLCWFEDLKEFFAVAARCLKPGGVILIQEIHPATNMLAVKGEDVYDENKPMNISWSYFKEEPFVDNYGMSYIAGEQYESKTFVSFGYKMCDVINGLSSNGFRIDYCNEYNYDVGGEFSVLDGKGYPLSFIMSANLEK